jgi:ankyrin repeat protein
MLDQRSFTKLHKAVLGLLCLDLRSELELLSQIAIDKTDSDSRTALTWAATRGDHDSVKLLLKYRADFRIASRNGSTPLHWAVQSPSLIAVDSLLNAGAEVDRFNNRGYTPLHFAASKQNDPRVLELLLSFQANIDAQTYHGDTALMNAARANHDGNVAYLIEHGANLDLQNKDGVTALLYAVCFNSHKCLKLLIQSPADRTLRTKEGNSFFHLLAIYSDLESLEILCSQPPRDQSLDLPRADGLSPSQLAEKRENVLPSWRMTFSKLCSLVLDSEEDEARLCTNDSDDETFHDAVAYQ